MIAEAAALRPAVYIVFDVLEVGGKDVRALPLIERRRLLHHHVERRAGLQIIEHVDQHGEALFRAIAADDHEGIVAKRGGCAVSRPRANELDKDQEQELLAAWRRGVAQLEAPATPSNNREAGGSAGMANGSLFR